MLRVAHIDTGRSYRGGQRQVHLLIKHLAQYDDIVQYLLCPHDSPLNGKCSQFVKRTIDIGATNFMRLLGRKEYQYFAKEERIDLLHAHSSHAHSLATLISPGGKRPRIIVTRRSAGRISFGSKTKYLKHNIEYIAISNFLKQMLVNGGVDPNRIKVIHSMLELDDYRAIYESRLNQKSDKAVFISAGAFDKSKGFFDIIQAAKRLQSKRDDFICMLFGNGEEEEKYNKFIAKNGLAETVILPGWADDTREYLSTGNCFITASYSEGLNSSLIEAMASGLIVIASDIEPHCENISEGQTGFLFKTGDIDSLCKKMEYILDNPVQMPRIRNLARERSMSYDSREIGNEIYRLYLQTIASS